MNTIFSLRVATPMDAGAMLEIYTPYILNTTASFETKPPSQEALAQRVGDILQRYPWLICERQGRVLGYAYAGPMGKRACYDWSVETSIYIKKDYHKQGLGVLLYQPLLALLQMQGFCTAYAQVASPHPQSEKFHEHLGFVKEGFLPRAGVKFGEYVGLTCYALTLHTAPPRDLPVGFPDLDVQEVENILKRDFDKTPFIPL